MNAAKFMNTRKITGIALLSALAVVLLYIPGLRFPIFPMAPFLEYDACDIPIMFATFAYGPISGLIVTFIVSVIQGTTISAGSGIYGILMHIIATGSFTLSAGFLFRFLKNRQNFDCFQCCQPQCLEQDFLHFQLHPQEQVGHLQCLHLLQLAYPNI